MFGLFDRGLCPIGIDVGAHAVRLLQFRNQGAALALQAACRIELASLDAAASPMERFTAAVRQALSLQPFSGKRVVLCLPASSIHAKSVRLPQMPDSDLSQALMWEAKDRFGFEIGDGRLVWFRAGEIRRGTEVKDELLLFAVQGEELSGYIQALKSLGLKFDAIDLSPCAVYRGMQRGATPRARYGEPEGGPTGAILDIGHASSQFLITRGDDLVFYKRIDIGGTAVIDAIAGKLGIPHAEAAQMRARLATESSDTQDAAPLNQALRDALRTPLEELARELDMCMRYYVVTFRGPRPEVITLAGRQASCLQVREALAGSLGLQIEQAQPLRGVLELGDVARPDRAGEWTLAAGLSLYSAAASGKITEKDAGSGGIAA